MIEPIQAGDLVQVIRPVPCCGSLVGLGVIYTTIWVGMARQQCECCGELLDTILIGAYVTEHPELGLRVHGHMVERVKKIPPFPELADERHDEEITA
jgi:hypothetical protein